MQRCIDKLRKDCANSGDAQKRESIANEVDLLELELEQNPIPILPRISSNNVTPESLENAVCEYEK